MGPGSAPEEGRPSLGMALLAAGWLTALAMAWLTTRYAQVCAPPALAIAVLGTAAVVFFAAGARSGRATLWAAGVLLITLLPVTRWLTAGGMPDGHDLSLHAWSVWAIGNAMNRGDLWPLWLDTLGVGQPVLQFYGPLPYMLGGALVKLGAAPRDALLLLSWLATALGAWGAWHVLRREGGGPAVAALAAAAFVLAPYRLLDINYRFALGEIFGLAAMLPCWHFLHRLLQRPGDRPALFGLVGTASFIVVTHPLSAILTAWGAIPIALHGVWTSGMRGRGVAAALLAGSLAFGVSAFHSVPAFLERGSTRVSARMPYDAPSYQAKALHVGQSLTRQRWDGRRHSLTLKEERVRKRQGLSVREAPHYLGWSLFVWLPLAAFAERRRDRTAAAYAAAAVLSWIATLGPAAWLMGHLSVFHPLQFPWRFLGPASIAAVAALALLHRHALRERPWFALVGLGVLLFDAWPGLGAGSWVEWPNRAAWEIHRRTGPAPSCSTGHGLRAAPASLDQLLTSRADLPRFVRDRTPAVAAALPARPQKRAAAWSDAATGDLRTRVWAVRLPPNVPDVDLSLLYRAAPEYYTPSVARQLQTPAVRGDVVAMEALGARLVLRTKNEPPVARLDPWPRLFHIRGDDLSEIAARVARPAPSSISIKLPEGVPAGLLVFAEQDFPGWSVQVDDGAWVRPDAWNGLLAVPISDGAGRVSFRYRATPIRRAATIASAASLLGILAAGFALRRS